MYTHVRISAIVLICGFVLSGQTQPRGPTDQDMQQGPPWCGWIGVQVSPMTPAFADSLGMAETYGAIFDQPQPGSPDDHAGIQAGDVITSINGAPVVRASDFATMISAIAPSTIVHLTTYRDGQMIEVKLMLGATKCLSEQHGGVLVPARSS
jgi:S1-C subfamily serine protease